MRREIAILVTVALFAVRPAQADAVSAEDQKLLMVLLKSPSMALLGAGCQALQKAGQAAPTSAGGKAVKDYCDDPTELKLVALAKVEEAQRLTFLCGQLQTCSGYLLAGTQAAVGITNVPDAPLQFPSLSISDALSGGLEALVMIGVRTEIQSIAVGRIKELMKDLCTTDPLLPKVCGFITGTETPSFASLKQGVMDDVRSLPAQLAKRADIAKNEKIRYSLAFIGALVAHGDLFESLREASTTQVELNVVALIGGLATFAETMESRESPLADATAAMILNAVYRPASKELLPSLIRRVRTTIRLASQLVDSGTGGRLSALLPTVERFIGDIALASRLFGEKASLLDSATLEIILSLANQQYTRFLVGTASLVKQACPQCFESKPMRVLTLGAEVLEAKTAEEISSAVATFATGGAKLREKRATLSIVGMLLGNGGISWRPNVDDTTAKELSLSAILGIEYAGAGCPIIKWCGITFSVIDALAQVAVADEGKQRRPTSMLAPGLYLELGLSKAAVLAVGISALPFGEKVTDAMDPTIKQEAIVLRGTASLGLSLPLLEWGSI